MAVDPTGARWARHQQAAARAMLRVLEHARVELLGALTDAAPGEQSLTVLHRQAMLVQVEAAIARLQTEMGIVLLSSVRKALTDGAGSAAKEVATLMRDQSLKIGLSRLNPALVEYHVTRATEHITTLTADLKSQIRMELAKGQAQGLHAREVARRIAARTDLPANDIGFKKPVFKSVYARAETIARTENAYAANAGFSQSLKAAQEMGLNVGKRWSATLDLRTSKRCKALHAKYNAHPIPLDQPFVAPDGWTGMRPPAHPNCRSRIASGHLED